MVKLKLAMRMVGGWWMDAQPERGALPAFPHQRPDLHRVLVRVRVLVLAWTSRTRNDEAPFFQWLVCVPCSAALVPEF